MTINNLKWKVNIIRWYLFSLILTTCGHAIPIDTLKLPPGFAIEIYAKVPNARQMSLGSKDTIFVGTKEAGKVFAVSRSKTGTKVHLIASGLTLPAAVDFYQAALYVAARDRILRFDNIENNLDTPPKPVVISNSLPKQNHHGWRFMRFGPDHKLYISIGAPCNICLNEDPRFATISRMDSNGNHFEIYAYGIRNSVGFDWDPITNYLWFTDNGRDWLGDHIPPDEINSAPQTNMHFGFPYCYGNNVPDPMFTKTACAKFFPPIYNLPAHVAALGTRFYTGKQFPAEYQGQLLIAEHGSWNRNKKIGYQVVIATLDNNRKQITAVKPFITGWLDNENVWGRPVDVLNMRDGSVLISDDLAGVIYRIFYKEKT